MINPRAMPGYLQIIPQVNNGGVVQSNFSQQQPLSTLYANATDLIHGYDQQQNVSLNSTTHQQDPWSIIQKMSEDNRALVEQISRLTTQLTQLQSILYQQQQQQQNIIHLSAAPAAHNEQITNMVISTEAENLGTKRTLSPFEDEIREANEMDIDPNTRIVNPLQKRRRAAGQVSTIGSTVNTVRYTQNGEQRKAATRTLTNEENVGDDRNAQQKPTVSEEAKRFAQSRYPFSPFVIKMKQNIRDKIIVDFLCKHVKDNHQAVLELAGYRCTVDDDPSYGYKLLLFVKNIDTFALLLDQKVWPKEMCGHSFNLIPPSIPPQLAVVIPDVPMNINMDEFSEEIRANYEQIVSVVRLRNRFQREIKAVKVEFSSVTARKNILNKNRMFIMGLSLEVVEYLAQAHVLICSQCMKIGHFRKNCPQTNEHTCSTCGDKCEDIKFHKAACSGVLKCIHCGGTHKSNDTKCPIVKDYRAALTRSLLTVQVQQDEHMRNSINHEFSKDPGSSSAWISHPRGLSELLESRWRTMSDDVIAFKSNMYTLMTEVCDLVINYGGTYNDVMNGDIIKKREEKTKSLNSLLNLLQPHVSTPFAS